MRGSGALALWVWVAPPVCALGVSWGLVRVQYIYRQSADSCFVFLVTFTRNMVAKGSKQPEVHQEWEPAKVGARLASCTPVPVLQHGCAAETNTLRGGL